MMRNSVIIIAEAGVNHNGDLKRAKDLIIAAADAGADYVKFQTIKADKLVSKEAKKADYQNRNINDGDTSQFEMLKKLEIPEEWYPEMLSLCLEKNIKFLSTGFDEQSIDFLDQLPITIFKIPSGEITNKPYLEHIARKNKPVILSTGMSNLKEIGEAVNVLINAGLRKADLTILHCNTEYPTPMSDVNLKAMNQIGDEFGVQVGYSDHTLGIEVPIAAVALGAKLIEKHFTLDRNLPGPDHAASLEPEELSAMVTAIRNIELAISGSGKKEVSNSERSNKTVARKSIHILKNLSSGHVITKDDLIMKRPGDGINPMRIHEVLGKKLSVDLAADSKLLEQHIL